jgi:hypothetical protein
MTQRWQSVGQSAGPAFVGQEGKKHPLVTRDRSVTAQSQLWFCVHSLAGIAGSNFPRVMNVSCECSVTCRWRSLRRADHSSRGVLPNVACMCVISEAQQ